MRHFKLVRPTAGFFHEAAALDLAHRLVGLNVKGPKHIVLALCGGRSMERLLPLLVRKLEATDRTVFPRLQIFETDSFEASAERPGTNWKTIMDGFGDYVVTHDLMTLGQLHRCPLTGNRADDLRVYSQKLGEFGGRFDVAVLSIGGGKFTTDGPEDTGHVAGIFPGNKEIWSATADFIAVTNAPKPPAVRVTASPHLLGKSGCLFALLEGEAKENALERLYGTKDPVNVPSHLLYGNGTGDALVYTDLPSV